MNTEFEATFIQINMEELRQKLRKIGADLVFSEIQMKRITYHPPSCVKNAWVRVRDEGNQITMSVKFWHGGGIEGQQEIELVVDDFEKANSFLLALGLKKKGFQETKREEWLYKDTHISIDTWPGLEPFVEIEGENEDIVKKVTKKLDFDYKDAIFGPVHKVYEKILGLDSHIINNLPEITFKNPPKSVL